MIGTGIFFLPGKAAALLGPAALLAFLVAALLCTLLVLCFAEAGSRFRGTGGPLLYARAAFPGRVGEATAFLVGWLTWVVRVTSWAALANGLVLAADALLPGAGAHRALLLVLLFAVLTGINLAGVALGSRVTTFFTAAKLVPLLAFLAVGLFAIAPRHFTPFAPQGLAPLGPGTLLILYAFVGFEVLSVPAGEMRDPQRSVPRALILIMSVVTLVYLGVWAVCAGTLGPALAGADNPVADAARLVLGPFGGRLIALGIFLSVLGINAGSALVTPRCLFALAAEGFLPRALARVHPRRGTPTIAILISGAVSLTLALTGSFVELAVLSMVGRFAQYIPTCLAVPLLRRRSEAPAATFQVPGGATVPLLAIGLCAWLLTQAPTDRLIWGLVGLLAGLVVYLPTQLLRRPR